MRPSNRNALRGSVQILGEFDVTKGGWGSMRSFGVGDSHVNNPILFVPAIWKVSQYYLSGKLDYGSAHVVEKFYANGITE